MAMVCVIIEEHYSTGGVSVLCCVSVMLYERESIFNLPLNPTTTYFCSQLHPECCLCKYVFRKRTVYWAMLTRVILLALGQSIE